VQLIQLNIMAQFASATLEMYPTFRAVTGEDVQHMNARSGDADDAESWKYNSEDGEEDDETALNADSDNSVSQRAAHYAPSWPWRF